MKAKPVPLPLDTILCGDNVETLRTFHAECIDLVVTSPPYDNLRTYGGHSWDFPGVAGELTRVLKPGGVIVWVVADATIDGSETLTSMKQAIHFKEVCRLNVHDTMIYQRQGKYPDELRYWQDFEYVFVVSKGRPETVNLIRDEKGLHAGRVENGTQRKENGELEVVRTNRVRAEFKARSNVWKLGAGRGLSTHDEAAYGHPAIFPEALARDHILSWSNPGDVVLDPFNGSGTTTKMARFCGRRYIGIDVNTDYCEIARNRLRQQLLPIMA